MEKWFPSLLIVLDVIAAGVYAWQVFFANALPIDDWRKVVYWLAAAVLTAMVTW